MADVFGVSKTGWQRPSATSIAATSFNRTARRFCGRARVEQLHVPCLVDEVVATIRRWSDVLGHERCSVGNDLALAAVLHFRKVPVHCISSRADCVRAGGRCLDDHIQVGDESVNCIHCSGWSCDCLRICPDTNCCRFGVNLAAAWDAQHSVSCVQTCMLNCMWCCVGPRCWLHLSTAWRE